MSFCPKCKSEYINGRPTCADCGTPLVESLDDIIEETQAEQTIKFSNYSSFELQSNSDEEKYTSDDSDSDSNSSSNSESENTSNSLENVDDSASDTVNTTPPPTPLRAFVSQKDRYKDYISTGYTFIIIGILGVIVLTLNLLDIVKIFYVSGASSFLFYTVMYSMFVIFIFVAINAFKHSNKIKQQSVDEDNFMNDLKHYIIDTITLDKFEGIDIEQSEEEIYFQRTEIIKNAILEKYPEINPSLLENVLDETYDTLF